jgi:hypothetical protein
VCGSVTNSQAEPSGEGNVHQQISYEERREELWPGQRNGEMVRVSHIEARNPVLLELKRAKANPRRSFTRVALESSVEVLSVLHPCARPTQSRGPTDAGASASGDDNFTIEGVNDYESRPGDDPQQLD